MREIIGIDKLRTWKDLYDFLRIYGIGIEEKRAKEIFESMDKPVLVARKRSWEGPTIGNVYLRKIVEVWEKENRRFVLWNDKVLEVSDPKNWRYKYMDRGFHEVGGVIIRAKNIPENSLEKIKRYLKSEGELIGFRSREAMTLEELEKMMKNESVYHAKKTIPREDVNRKRMDLVSRILEGLGGEIRIEERYIVINGVRIGIESKRLVDYIDFEGIHLGITDGEEPLKEMVLKEFTEDLLSLKEELEVRLGKFKVKYARDKRNRILLDGRETYLDNFEYLIERGIEMKNKKEFSKLQRDLETIPITVRKFLENGLTMSSAPFSDMSYSYVPEFILKLKLKFKDNKWFAVSPLTKREYAVNDSDSCFSSLGRRMSRSEMHSKQGIFMEQLQVDCLENSPLVMLKKLRKIFGEEEAFKLMDLAKKNAEIAKKKAQKLLEDLKSKYRNRIIEGELMGEKGFIVKGNIRNYFVDECFLNVSTYPRGSDICIVEKESSEHYFPADKLVSRILLLLNDKDLRGHVRTLDVDGEEIEIMEM
jgi:hypothetical protein